MNAETKSSAFEEKAVFPHGLNNAFLFSGFNALSYPIVLSSPMVLYAKTLGASATVLGIIAGMMPLLVIFQIPAANYINRIGYKRFVFGGWGTRVMFVFAMALAPLTGGFLDANNRLGLMLMLLFCFNLSRGISSCAWLPWITALVPPTLRGKYLARDAGIQNLSNCIAFLISAAVLRTEPSPWQFTVLFGFSAIAGAMSLNFLKKIPDVEIPEDVRASKTRVPWLEMIRYAPFKKLLITIACWSLAYGGMTVFTVAFLKSEVRMPEGEILLVSSVSFLGGFSSLWLLGHRLDKLGSKPVLAFAFCGWLVVLIGWTMLSGAAIPTKLFIVLVLQFFMGLLAALVSMAHNRLAMAVIPIMGRNHFFALYSVFANVSLGIAPILWGLVIDAVGGRHAVWLGLDWNRFTVFYSAVALVFVVTLIFARRLEEPEAASMEELLREILIQSPQRFWLRFWPRA